MRVRELVRRQVLPGRLEQVFAFFAEPRNLEAITPPWLHFRIDELPAAPLRAGDRIRYRLRLRGVPLGWTTEISAMEPPRRFVDRQLRGPYRLWEHEHHFEPLGDDVLMTDRVRYAHWGGTLVERLLVRPDLERIFDHRRERLEQLLGRPEVPAAPVA